jgi:hypothetical protein
MKSGKPTRVFFTDADGLEHELTSSVIRASFHISPEVGESIIRSFNRSHRKNIQFLVARDIYLDRQGEN